MRSLLISTILLALSHGLMAQSLRDLRKYDRPASSYEADLPPSCRLEYGSGYAALRHPSLAGMDMDSTRRFSSVVEAVYADRRSHGDYFHYQGNHSSNIGILAGGEMYVKNIGTLYGHAYYGRENIHGMYQNYAVRPEDYAPYFVSDSLDIGNLTNEHYVIEGGLSMSHRNWRYGVGLLYEGISGAKTTQVRREVYSYWFRPALSAAYLTPKWIVSAKIWPEINKQSVSASSSVKTFRCMQFYGFGQWNRKESLTGYGYSRDNKILGFGAELLLSSMPAPSQKWSLTATAAYNYRSLQTEEASFKNLYQSTTHHLNHNLILSGKLRRNLSLYLQLYGQGTMRSGHENVYERQRQDDEQSLYDYVKVGTNHLYSLSEFHETFLTKGILSATPAHVFTLFAGVGAYWRKELYRMPEISVRNCTLTPQAGIGYTLHSGRSLLDIEIASGYRLGVNNAMSLPSSYPTQFEIAQTYIPYRLRGESRWQLHSVITYIHRLSHGSIGSRINAGYGHRTSAPAVPVLLPGDNDNHYSRNISIGVFYIF